MLDYGVETTPLKLFSIHCPKIAGASCTYTETDKTSSLGAFTMMILGIGGGGKMQAYLKLGAD